MVPDGWQVVNLGDVAKESNKKLLPTKDDRQIYIGLEHIEPGSPYITRMGWSSEVSSTKTVFRVGDILFGKLRPYLRKVILANKEGICSTDILVITPKKAISPQFLHTVLSSEKAISHAVNSSAGTKMPRTSWKSLSEYSFLLPPFSEQKRIAEIFSSVDEAIASTQAVIDQTRKIKGSCVLSVLNL